MTDETRAVAHLPALDIEIVHRRAPDDSGEILAIQLRATPSFEGFQRYVEGNPFLAPWLAWMKFVEASWAPFGLLPAPPRRGE
jgi:hypothetical protein